MVSNQDGMSDIPEYGLHMTIEDFISSVKDGMFVDYDGHGRYANAKQMSNQYIYPSDVAKNHVLEGWTYVVWFNK